uniref:uncharacterized protein LOC120340384 n=1 Tax=Styela clava TaxID=7725 RepID=UPI00193ABC31|nr:uncharacterized protein LOC120340384 [Styela clava]
MIFVKVFCFFLLIGLSFGKKLPDGVCVTKLVKGKLISVGDCKKGDGSEIANLIKESLAKKQQQKCDVTYKKKCFRARCRTNLRINERKTREYLRPRPLPAAAPSSTFTDSCWSDIY